MSEYMINEDKIAEIVIDFEQLREKQLDESFIGMFGAWVKILLKRMFGNSSMPVKVKGSRSEVESFARTLGGEKRYIETASKYGLDDPRTYKNKAKLTKAINNFERATGLKWPFN